jgi:hypothetical protein
MGPDQLRQDRKEGRPKTDQRQGPESGRFTPVFPLSADHPAYYDGQHKFPDHIPGH